MLIIIQLYLIFINISIFLCIYIYTIIYNIIVFSFIINYNGTVLRATALWQSGLC